MAACKIDGCRRKAALCREDGRLSAQSRLRAALLFLGCSLASAAPAVENHRMSDIDSSEKHGLAQRIDRFIKGLERAKGGPPPAESHHVVGGPRWLHAT